MRLTFPVLSLWTGAAAASIGAFVTHINKSIYAGKRINEFSHDDKKYEIVEFVASDVFLHDMVTKDTKYVVQNGQIKTETAEKMLRILHFRRNNKSVYHWFVGNSKIDYVYWPQITEWNSYNEEEGRELAMLSDENFCPMIGGEQKYHFMKHNTNINIAQSGKDILAMSIDTPRIVFEEMIHNRYVKKGTNAWLYVLLYLLFVLWLWHASGNARRKCYKE